MERWSNPPLLCPAAILKAIAPEDYNRHLHRKCRSVVRHLIDITFSCFVSVFLSTVLTPLPGTNFLNKSVAFFDSGAVIWKLTTLNLPNVLTDPTSFVSTLKAMTQAANTKGTDHLLLDLIGNGGGSITLAYMLLLALEPSWAQNLTLLSEDYDVRVSPMLQRISGNIAETHRQFPKRISLPDALAYVSRLATFDTNLQTYLGVLGLNPRNIHVLQENLKKKGLSDIQRAQTLHRFVNTSLLEPVQQSILANMATPMNKALTASLSLEALVKNTVKYRRGGILGNYSQKFSSGDALAAFSMYQSHLSSFLSQKVFKRVTILTDGTCGSSCSLILTKLMLEGKAVVISYGGLRNQNMDTSSFAGGNVMVSR